MRKNTLIHALIISLGLGLTTAAGQWDVFAGNELPADIGWTESNTSNNDGVSEITTVVPDPDIAGNKLIRVDSHYKGSSFKEQWKMEIGGDPTAGQTVVFRAAALDTSLFDRDIDVYLYNGAYRDRITTRENGTLIKFDKTPDNAALDATVWHLYRFTGQNDSFTVYIDEVTTPIITGLSPADHTDKFFRFGDGGGDTYGAVYDWFIWDTTGAYAPGAGTAIPDSLSIVTGTTPSVIPGWGVFTGDELPADIGWSESNATNLDGISEITTVVNDPDSAGNKLIRVDSHYKGGSFKEQWKMEIGGDDPTVGHTVVFRAAALDTSLFDRDIDVYLYNGAYRDRITTRENGTLIKFDKTPDEAALDATVWHLYRFTGQNDSFAVYIDEATTPIIAGLSPADHTDRFFRFGDGGGDTYGAVYDWFIWDTTGAYAPGEGAELPDNLSAATGSVPSAIPGWGVFACDVLPEVAGWTESNATNANDTTEILTVIDDLDVTGNKLIKVDSHWKWATFKEQWKMEIGGDPAAGQTIVFRAAALDTSLFDRDIDVYLYNGAYRDRITTREHGTLIKFDKTPDEAAMDATVWHLYRFTGQNDSFAVYIDEATTPIMGGRSPVDDTDKFFRFGDGGGDTYGAIYDWFIWDTTGAYAPGEGAELPGNLSDSTGALPSIPPGWDVFTCDELPEVAGWTESNATNANDTTEILDVLDDPDITDNNVIRVNSHYMGAEFKEQWKMEIGGDPAVGQTVVFRAVALDTSLFDRDIDVYLYNGAYRDRITTRENGTLIKFDKTPDEAALDATVWHLYRFTGQNDSFAVYIDEATTPIMGGRSPADHTDMFFRFGDGGGDTYGAVYDWFFWDTTGAFPPGKGPALPENISTATGTGTGVTVEIVDTEQLPERFELSQNYPNPFNPRTQIQFKVSETATVHLTVYDLTGRLVHTLVHDRKQPGTYHVQWNGRNNLGELLPSGVYFYLLEAGDYRATKKMLLLK